VAATTGSDTGRARLLEEAEDLRALGDRLRGVADQVESSLEAVVGGLGPPTWSGHAASTAASAGEHARDDLRVAAEALREIARELDLAAGVLEWRAARVAVGPVPAP
jgi:hypothetical protein